MKIVEENHTMLLYGTRYNFTSLFMGVFFMLLSLFLCFIATRADNYMWLGFGVAGMHLLLGFMYLFANLAMTCEINKQTNVLTLHSWRLLGTFPKTQTVALRTIRSLSVYLVNSFGGRSDKKAFFAFNLENGAKLHFVTCRPKITNMPFWSWRSAFIKSENVRTNEQDVIAPKVAKFLGVKLST